MKSALPLVVLMSIVGCTAKDNARDRSPASSTASARPENRSCGDRVIREDGIGELRLGMSADSVKAICPVAFDTVRPGPEGMSERVIKVEFPPEAAEAEIVADSVWRLSVTTAGFQTRDSIRVGTSVQELLRHDDAQGLVGEGKLVVVFRRQCGMSFILTGGIPRGRVRNWNRAALAKLPPNTAVERILVFGCPPARG